MKRVSDERFHSGCSSLRSLFVPWEVDRWRSVMAPRLLFPLFPPQIEISISRSILFYQSVVIIEVIEAKVSI